MLKTIDTSKQSNFDFANILTLLVTNIIGKEKIVFPEKEFIISILKIYSESNGFVDLSYSKSNLGLITNYSLDIAEKEKAALQTQYENSEHMKTIYLGASEIDIFIFCRMRKHISDEFFSHYKDTD